MAAAAVDHLTLAFHLDRSFEPVAVALREEGGALRVDMAGTRDEAAVVKQIGRILGLEADADAWLGLAQRDPVIGGLQRAFPGFFTAAKASPYDAATWSVIAPRMNQRQAASIKQAMARELGARVVLLGRVHHVFPSPEVLAKLPRFAGLSDEKVASLRGIGQAAQSGFLDAERLRGLGEQRALTELQALRGVGPWAASRIYYRGAAPLDELPTGEPRVLHGLASAYRLEAPSEEVFRRIASGWRPFRMWVCVLLMRHLARSGGWNAPELARKRVSAGGKQLLRRAPKPAA